MRIVIEKTEYGLEIDLGSTDWDLTEVMGMLERAKMTIWDSINPKRSDSQ